MLLVSKKLKGDFFVHKSNGCCSVIPERPPPPSSLMLLVGDMMTVEGWPWVEAACCGKSLLRPSCWHSAKNFWYCRKILMDGRRDEP